MTPAVAPATRSAQRVEHSITRREGYGVQNRQRSATDRPPITRTGVLSESHRHRVAFVARAFEVDLQNGLTCEQAIGRLAAYGRNQMAEQREESPAAAFARQYHDVMQVVLLIAAAVSLVVTGDVATSFLLTALTVVNAVIGLRQEAKAEQSVRALAEMTRYQARVCRDGHVSEIDVEELVPGDLVLLEAGNRVPADGRVCVAAGLEAEEA